MASATKTLNHRRGRAAALRAALVRARDPGAHLTWVVLGKALLMGSNTALLLFLAAKLPIAVYGLFVAVAGAQVVLSRAVLAGTDGGVVRLSSIPGPFARGECIGAGVVILRRTALAAALGGLLAMVLPLPWPSWVGPVVAGGAIGIALVDFGYFCRLARLEYRAASLVQGGMGSARLAAVAIAVLVWPAQPVAVFIAYAAGSLATGLVQFLTAARSSSRPSRDMVKRLFRYSMWQGTASILCTAALQVGTFVFFVLKQPDAAGIFGLGLSLSLPFFFFYNAFYEFLLARISRANARRLGRTVLGWTAVAFGLALAGLPAAALAGLVFPWVLRPGLHTSIPVFYWLAASQLLLVPQAVFEAASHALLRPIFVAAGWAVRLASTAVAIFLFARGGGPVRGAAGQFLAGLIALAVIVVLVLLRMRKRANWSLLRTGL
jgi:O-antigen/teichoic acid export membrane protein